jgi:hypothetical protein
MIRRRANAAATVITNSNEQQDFTMYTTSNRRRLQDKQSNEQEYSENQPIQHLRNDERSKEKQLWLVFLNRIKLSRICHYIVPLALFTFISFSLYLHRYQNIKLVSLYKFSMLFV